MKHSKKSLLSLCAALVMAVSFLLSCAAASPIPSFIDLEIPEEFAVTRPTSEINTSYSSYFITGTSNPGQPVYLGDVEIDRIGTMGTFGVLVDLEPGINTFVLSQGGTSETVKINRVTGGSSTITEITQGSMYPAENSYVKHGGTIPVSCVAPAGSKVTASIGGKSIVLTQVVSGASTGIPAAFSATMTPPSSLFESGETTEAGKINYTLTYKGKTTAYKSSASLYTVGEGATPVIRVRNTIGIVYKDADTSSNFRVQLKKGTVDYATGQENGRFKLSSGGYMPKSNGEILTGSESISNKISKVSTVYKDRFESYVISGTAQAAFYPATINDGESFVLQLYNSQNAPVVDAKNSKLFSGASSQELDQNRVRFTFKLKEGQSIWGYNVNYNKNGNMVLTFMYKPQLASGSRPFENLVILLDPGHGGTDPGAMGVAGTSGPNESDLNLAHAYVVKSELEDLGATVYLTREKNDYVSLDDRIELIEKYRPDFFLSLHHNSIAESANANTALGTEIYYHTGLSKKTAASIIASVTEKMGRKNRGVFQSYYRVTLLPYCPSMLLELGFMSNPKEYESSTTLDTMQNAADGIVNSIKSVL